VATHLRRRRVTQIRPNVIRTFAVNSPPALQIVDADTARVLAEWLKSHADVQVSIRLEHRGSPGTSKVLDYAAEPIAS